MSLERYEEEKENLLGKEKKEDDYHLQASVQQAPSRFAQPQVISLTKAKAQLTWNNIQVDAILPDGKIKKILHGFKGTVKPGQFLAIMGPTGCGKTTFMNCLCNRINYNAMEVRGSVLCNGKELNLLPYRHMTAYCQQEDVLIPNLTPREMLVFKARLTLNKSMEEINNWVSKILKKLGLEGCAETQAGSDETRGLSGGERKRTSVALELVKDPLIIFLDEPTTGLDSTAALGVVNSCIELSKEGKLVISVIHQPDYDSFIRFDQLMLLAEGRCVYLGPASQCEGYFNQLGHNVPEHTDASEYFLTLLSIEGSDYSKTIEEQKQEYRKKIMDLETSFKNKQDQEEIKLEDNLPDMSKQEWFQMYENMIGQKESQTRILIQRNAKNTLRDRATIQGLVARSIFPAFVFIFTYARFSTQTESQYDRNGAIIMISLVVGFASSAFLVNFTFFQERSNLIREAVFVLIMSGTLGIGLSLILSPQFSQPAQGTQWLQVIGMTGLRLSGCILNNETFPKMFHWLKYISFFQYITGALLWNEYEDLVLDCYRDYHPCTPMQDYHYDFDKWGNFYVLLLFSAVFIGGSYISIHYFLQKHNFNKKELAQ